MAQAERKPLNGPSIDGMLRGLTERPNVQSTLILSRKDGSIIRAAGDGAPENRDSLASGKAYEWPQAQESNDTLEGRDKEPTSTVDTTEEPASAQPTAKPLDILAATVFQFVNNASVLGEILGASARNGIRANDAYAPGYGEAINTSQKGPALEDDADDFAGEAEVQLLRLRLKHQEIIIFPDANYICCVVQRVGKAGTSQDRR